MTLMLQISTDKKICENRFNRCHVCSNNGERRGQIKIRTLMLQISTDKKIRENRFNLCHLCSTNLKSNKFERKIPLCIIE